MNGTMTGSKLGSYEIGEKLGEGGMGEVWRARDSRLNRAVAVKVLPANAAGDPARRLRFEQEARSLGALNHPNIVAVYDVGESGGQDYIVSELVEGESLRKLVERGPIPSRRLLEMAVQIADAVAAAHALGIVHRDLKPENIMISRDGRVKVLDFGLAKYNGPPAHGDETATLAMSQPGLVLGTVGYMSPEQVRGEIVDPRSDLFSFGCVLYEMATGRRAFEGKSAADVMSAILKEEPPEMSASAAAAPPALENIVRRCLEKEPAHRFQSAADLAFALRSVSSLSSSSQFAAVAPPTRRNWIRPAAFALASVAVLAAGYLLRGGTHQPAAPVFQRLTFREGRVTAARFIPGGRNVVYSATWEGGPSRVYLATPGNPESRDLDLNDSRLLAVSSKGDLAFLVGPFFPDGSGTLARNSIGGGTTRELLEHVRLADWSPDGMDLAVVRSENGKSRIEYPTGKLLLETAYGPFSIRVSPDGQSVALTTYGNGTSVKIAVVDRSGKVRDLGVVSGQTQDFDAASLCWNAGGNEIWYRSFDSAEWNTIYALALDGSRRVVARFPGFVALHDLAPDGRMLLSTENGRMGIRALAPGETMERDLSCLDASDLRGISEDGRAIVVDALGDSGGVKGSIYLRRTDGSPPLRLGDGVALTVSPDARYIAGYSSQQTASRKFIIMPTGPGETVEASIPGHDALIIGWLAGAEQYLAAGREPGKKWQYFSWEARSRSFRPLTPDGVPDVIPLISPDKRKFLVQCPDRAWCVYSVDGGEPKRVIGLSPHDQPVGWRADSQSLYFTTHHDRQDTMPVSVLDIETAARKPWKEIRVPMAVDRVSNVRVTPDGRAYAYNYSYVHSSLFAAEGFR